MPEWSPETVVDTELARRLIREQFREVTAANVHLLGSGWDATVYLVDEKWVFRFPRREIAVAGIEREISVLPRLTELPLPIPTPQFIGRRSEHYPWPFFGARYIAGEEIATTRFDADARDALGAPLGRFLRSLHDPARLEPLADLLPADPMGRADMRSRVPRTRERLDEVERLKLWPIPSTVAGVLDAAWELPPTQPTAVVHGDLHVRHLLITPDAGLAGVIDWGDVCRGDPAIDLSLYWSLLSNRGRQALRASYGSITDAQLLRARVLSLFLNAVLAAYARAEGRHELTAEAIAGLERTMCQ